jgi:origin recognition complex subunit 3
MDHEKCYVFTQERPAKRRRVEEAQSLDSSLPLREQLYRDAWAQQEHRINDVVKSANEATLDEVSSFLSDCQHDEKSEGLPVGFILAGPSIAAHAFIFEQLLERTQDKRTNVFIPVSSTDGPNLRTLLKAIIKTGTSHTVADEDELALAPSKRNGRKLLDYDLQILHEWVRENGIKQVVVAFRDCEAFDSVVLSEVIELLS